MVEGISGKLQRHTWRIGISAGAFWGADGDHGFGETGNGKLISGDKWGMNYYFFTLMFRTPQGFHAGDMTFGDSIVLR